MWHETASRWKLLFVHERFGPFAGAESNILATARALNERGHTLGLLHGPATGKRDVAWREAFPSRFPLASRDNASQVMAALDAFQPDAVYVHKMADLTVIEALVDSGVPLARMVHDHDLYCMRSYKYNYFTRRICER